GVQHLHHILLCERMRELRQLFLDKMQPEQASLVRREARSRLRWQPEAFMELPHVINCVHLSCPSSSAILFRLLRCRTSNTESPSGQASQGCAAGHPEAVSRGA